MKTKEEVKNLLGKEESERAEHDALFELLKTKIKNE